jgi:hypothetical protein
MGLFSKPLAQQNNKGVVFKKPTKATDDRGSFLRRAGGFLGRVFGGSPEKKEARQERRADRREKKDQEVQEFVQKSPTLSFLQEKVGEPMVRFKKRLDESNTEARAQTPDQRKESRQKAKEATVRFFKPGEKKKLDTPDPVFGTEKRETSPFGKALGALGQEVLKGVGRIAVGLSEVGERGVVNKITGEKGTPRTEAFRQKIVEPVVGFGEELKSPLDFARKIQKEVEDRGAKGAESKLVFTGSLILSTLFESPIGGPGKADDLFSFISKTDDVAKIEARLIKEGFDEATSKTYARGLQKVENPQAVENFFKNKVDQAEEVVKRIAPESSTKKVADNKNQDLYEEAKKYDSAEEFYQQSKSDIKDELRSMGIKGEEQVSKWWNENVGKRVDTLEGAMDHRPTKTGATASDISQQASDMGIPDFYERPEYYHFGGKEYDESVSALMKIRNKPNAEVTIYRASPKNELRNGDWVTLSKEKARLESLQEGTEVHSFKVKAKDVEFAGDDITEFGYWGDSKIPPKEIKTPRFQKSTKEAADNAESRLKKEFEEKQTKIRQANQAQEEALFPTEGRADIKGAVERKLQPFKFTEPEVKSAFEEWQSKTLASRRLADQEIEKLAKGFPTDKAESFKVITDYQKGVQNQFTPQIKKVFDELYQEARTRGLDANYIENYLPQVYKESSEEVIDKISKYLADKGLSAEEIKNYIRGRALPANTATALKLRPNFTKERVFPNYEVAAKYGLTPKYRHPSQLAAYYREEMEKTLANVKFVEDLAGSGKILKAGDAPRNWKSLDAPSFDGYKAPEYLSKIIDDLFTREAGQFSVRDRIVEGIANLSKRMQEIALSGGVPLTNINFFSIGQTIKEMTRGNFKAVSAFLRANFNERSIKYLKDNQKYMKMMAEEGIDLGEHVASYSRTFDTLKEKLDPTKKKTWTNFFGDKGAFDTLFNDKTFSSFMPQMHTQVFKDTFEGAVKNGLAEAEAKKIAADITKKTFGLVDQWGRSKGTQDVMSATFFAPRFREGILNTLLNTGKSVTTELRNPAFKNNRRLALGMLVTYAGYNALNKQLNGHYMWENPSGRQFALRIPIEEGKGSMYIEFMPSFLAFGRNLIQGALATAKGNVKEAGQKFGSVFSMPVKLVSEALSNKDYFGREIYEEQDSIGTKASKVAAHLGLAVAHPFIKEFIKQQGWDKGKQTPKEERPPVYQAMLRAMELPVKFGVKAKEDAGEYYDNLAEERKQSARDRKKYEKVLDQIIETRDSGDKEKAEALYDALTSEEKKKIKNISQARKTQETRQRKVELYSFLIDLREARDRGDREIAEEMYSSLSLEDKKLLKKVSEENPAEPKEEAEPIEEGTLSEEKAKSEIIKFAKAFGVSPVVALKILISRNKIEYVKDGVVKVERLPFRGADSSSWIRAEGGADSTLRLDHTIPLQLGGTNADRNLELVSVEDWASYTPVENGLRRQIQDGKIGLMKARSLIKKFKKGKITAEEALDN